MTQEQRRFPPRKENIHWQIVEARQFAQRGLIDIQEIVKELTASGYLELNPEETGVLLLWQPFWFELGKCAAAREAEHLLEQARLSAKAEAFEEMKAGMDDVTLANLESDDDSNIGHIDMWNGMRFWVQKKAKEARAKLGEKS